MSNALEKSLEQQGNDINKNVDSPAGETHPIGEAITRFLHMARDVKWTCRVFTPAAVEIMTTRHKKAVEQLKNSESLLTSNNAIERVHGMKRTVESIRKLRRINYSKIPEVLETSLFLSLFTAFDTFTGELLTAIYNRKPELFDKLNRQIELVDVLTASSIEELKNSVLEAEIENFRRKSYVEQFSDLEKTFGISLKKFSRWAEFVECTQRRNLLTHCGGVVSQQYINVCKKEGCPEKDIPPLGTKLELGPDYFLATCELIIEIGLKLGQTLWRKILPNELKDADNHLHNTQYEALYSQNWSRAKVFGEFAVSQRDFSNELARRLSLINYCIALKFSGDNDKAQEEMKKVDWTASINDFKLAESILLDRYEEAASLMLKIGSKGVYVSEHGYHSWPLLLEFREHPEFMEAYEKVYGYSFVAELKRTANKAMTDASENTSGVETISAELPPSNVGIKEQS